MRHNRSALINDDFRRVRVRVNRILFQCLCRNHDRFLNRINELRQDYLWLINHSSRSIPFGDFHLRNTRVNTAAVLRTNEASRPTRCAASPMSATTSAGGNALSRSRTLTAVAAVATRCGRFTSREADDVATLLIFVLAVQERRSRGVGTTLTGAENE